MDVEKLPRLWPTWRLRPDLVRQVVFLAFLALVSCLSIRWLQEMLPLYLPRDWSKSHEYDALIDWKAARLYLRGESPFSPKGLQELGVIGFGHPPTTAFWFLPLARFDKAIAAEILDISTLLFLGIHLYVCAKEFKLKAPLLWTILLFSWVMTTQGLLMHWDAIQLSEQIALALTLCWVYLRRGRDVPAGIMLGIALSLKLFPGVLVLMLLLAGRFRAVLACTAVFLVTSFAMTSVFGLEAWRLFFEQQPAIAEPWIGSIRNASLQGVVLRALTPVCVMPAVANKTGSLIASGISLLLFVASWLASRRSLSVARKSDPRAIDLPFALFSVLAVFANAWVWEHYSLIMITSGFIALVSSSRALMSAWRSWLDGTLANRSLVVEGALGVMTLLAVLACMKMFAMNIHVKSFLPDHYRLTKWPDSHWYLHFFEAISWLPWAVMLVLCLGLAWYRGRAYRN